MVLVAGFASCAVLCAHTDFRQAGWGMTKSQVLASETKQPAAVTERNGEVIVRYDSLNMARLDCHVVYIFAQDKLVRAKYLFEGEHSDRNEFIADYRAVEPLLIEQFGKPSNARAVWENDSTQDEPKSYLDQDRASPASILPSDRLVGLAVSLGHLRLFTEWVGARSRVLHALTGGNEQITHQIEYRAVAFESFEEQVRREHEHGEYLK
jgi:hypothetical protein